ncbi:MotA/TolQ/ExbB proton channel family protein [Aestuariirhabdus sp. Z084]|uniref:MotA/TolQ/ExbB proton channel family protein n=1 Tax=Aestuariirhabdus haliotis TaxID=2918751 RepID=UPI00201B4382|nr:MotA/TolQ/ExbB proton channel family protein [Aestuariirhabdus haliotis]MCL6417571.1 MotA/TolQ/ExbB proton channel family protein [Aestuariirhabdus haliotis]MCL6420595.1 MotA/TolQ/ExbB proton channel family protein [Aestuariirhabdus haliotis]
MLPDWNPWWFELEQFFHTGGWVLYGILLACFLMLLLILERVLFRFKDYQPLKLRLNQHLESDLDWRLKISQIVDLNIALNTSLPLIKTLIALCPLIGLTGTVTGMIQVFESLAIHGTGNPRLMAAGVASATFPTMAGIAISVMGLLFYGRLKRWSDKEQLALLNIKTGLQLNHT